MIRMQQELQNKALQIVNDSSYDAEWKKAAEMLRAPYWDWALKAGDGVPPEEVIAQQEITVHTPHGTKKMKNPLFSYTFHPKVDPSFKYPFDGWLETLRYPRTNQGGGAESCVWCLIEYESLIFSAVSFFDSQSC